MVKKIKKFLERITKWLQEKDCSNCAHSGYISGMIVDCEVKKVTDKYVVLAARDNIFRESIIEVKAVILHNTLMHVRNAQSELDLAKERLEKIMNMAVTEE